MLYFYRSNKVLIVLLSCFLAACPAFSLEEKKEETKTLYLEGVQYPKKTPPPLPAFRPPKPSSGPLISSNIGYGYLFYGSKNVIRSPVYEALIGYHIGNSLKIAGSYQYQQADFDIRVKAVTNIGSHAFHFENQMRKTTLALQSFAVRLIAAPSEPGRWSVFKVYPYLSIGVGYGWADLKRMANFKDTVYLFDLGIAIGANFLSATVGCKYNSWALSNQLYSLVPYVGVQLSF